MKRSVRAGSAGGGARLVVAAVVGMVPLLAACDSSSAGGTEESSPAVASPVSATGSAAAGPADDRELQQRLAGFDPEIEGFARPDSGDEPTETASEAFGSAIAVVEPARCNALEQAVGLGTDEDLRDAANDLVRYPGFFVPGGVMPAEPPFDPSIGLVTRVFGDEALAASLYTTLLEADCTSYTMTQDLGVHDRVLEQTVDDVVEVHLDGLEEPTVRVVYGSGRAYGVDEDGRIEEGDFRDSWSEYVHVDGPFVIMVETATIDDEEAVVAQIIADYLAHMNGA
ncbi:hypothetical protein [Demequina rhizosphaerae]|uniref:hypothetical protein n=1 Tax=Demequina rhizosphaerae TaxID=1638985 RepID=UPI000AB1D452|nr:hypothetical protein [Demequina rhizosphaerae]